MREPYRKGVAYHLDPESCAGAGNRAGEALTGAHVGQGGLTREAQHGVTIASPSAITGRAPIKRGYRSYTIARQARDGVYRCYELTYDGFGRVQRRYADPEEAAVALALAE